MQNKVAVSSGYYYENGKRILLSANTSKIEQ